MANPFFLESIPDTPVGSLALASTQNGLAAVEIGIVDLEAWCRRKKLPAGSVLLEPGPFPLVAQFAEYFMGDRRAFDFPLDLGEVTDFQRRVYSAVLAVPYGETRTYVQIASQLGRPGAARAVGGANAANPLAIVVPCHRLIGADGSLRGYGAPGGTEMKAWLLRFEVIQAARS